MMLSAMSQARKDNCCVIPLIRSSSSSEIHRDRDRKVVARGRERGEMGSYCLMGTEFQMFKMKRVRDGGGGGTMMFNGADPILTKG